MKSDLTCYEGSRHDGDTLVTVDGEFLDHRISLQLHSHSPDGFEWGYCGSGPAQLALGLLFDFLEGEPDRNARALANYQNFKFTTIARLDQHQDWLLSGFQLRLALESLEAERREAP